MQLDKRGAVHGITIDLSKIGESGVFVTGGPAGGANAGWGVGGGIVVHDIEGWSSNIDANIGAASGTVMFDDSGFNGLAGSVGPGVGLSVSATYTQTYSINDLIDDTSNLFSGNDNSGYPCP